MKDAKIPEGFEPLATESPFNLNVGPLYCRRTDHGFVFGILVEEKHCNRSGKLHGAMVGAIADIALGHNVGLVLAEQGVFDGVTSSGAPGAPIATVNMNTDYAGTASVGDWVEVRVDVQRTGRTLAFANAYLHSGAERIARTSAIFRVMMG